jgi:hypothetical protein
MSDAVQGYPSSVVSAVVHRYADAYVVARTIDGVGSAIKVIGLVIGALLALGSLVAGSKGGFAIMIAFVGIAVAGAIATVLYLLGTLASAQGQILMAALDSAVNSSHFLTDQDRARIMTLPYRTPVASAPTAPLADWRCRCGQTNPPATSACLDCGLQFP